MKLHALTLLIANIATVAGVVIALLFLRESLRRDAALRQWLFGCVAIGLGLTAFAMQQVLPLLLGIALSNLLIYGGLATLLAALLSLSGRRAPVVLLGLPIVALAAAQVLQPSDADSRRLLSAIVGVALFLAAAVVALQPVAGTSRRTRSVLAVSLLLGSIAFAMRIVAVLRPMLAGDPSITLDVSHGLFLIASLLASSFAMVLIHLEREGEQSHRLATLDPQTSSYNRHTLLQLGQRELARAQRRERPLSVLMMKVDEPLRGSPARSPQDDERAVLHLAELVAATLQRQDLFGRFGSAEFCAVLPDTALDGGHQVAERLRIRAETVSGTECGVPYTLTVSVAERMPNELSFLQLSSRADAALHGASAANQIVDANDGGPMTRANVSAAKG